MSFGGNLGGVIIIASSASYDKEADKAGELCVQEYLVVV